MRLRTFSAPTMAEAMAQVRDALGPEAIIVSTYKGKRGRGVEVKAAVEASARPIPDEPLDAANALGREAIAELEERLRRQLRREVELELRETQGDILPRRSGAGAIATTRRMGKAQLEILARALKHHGLPSELIKSLLTAARAMDADDPEKALAAAIETRFGIEMIPSIPQRSLMLIGPPGAGKTATAAKLAARAVLAGSGVRLISTDTVKMGAAAQMQGYADLLEQKASHADNPSELRSLLNYRAQGLAIIDTPGTNPFNIAEIEDLAHFIRAAKAEPVLVLPAGGEMLDMIDMAHVFRKLGATRMIITRMDVARRWGGILAAADSAGLRFAQVSRTPYVADGLTPINPLSLARLLLKGVCGPKPKSEEPIAS